MTTSFQNNEGKIIKLKKVEVKSPLKYVVGAETPNSLILNALHYLDTIVLEFT
jgi:hypothetical protein